MWYRFEFVDLNFLIFQISWPLYLVAPDEKSEKLSQHKLTLISFASAFPHCGLGRRCGFKGIYERTLTVGSDDLCLCRDCPHCLISPILHRRDRDVTYMGGNENLHFLSVSDSCFDPFLSIHLPVLLFCQY